MFGLSGGEILLIALIAIVLFGNEKLPEHLKQFFQRWRQAKKAIGNVQNSWHDLKRDVEYGLTTEKKSTPPQQLNPTITPQIAQDVISQEEIDSVQQNLHKQDSSVSP